MPLNSRRSYAWTHIQTCMSKHTCMQTQFEPFAEHGLQTCLLQQRPMSLASSCACCCFRAIISRNSGCSTMTIGVHALPSAHVLRTCLSRWRPLSSVDVFASCCLTVMCRQNTSKQAVCKARCWTQRLLTHHTATASAAHVTRDYLSRWRPLSLVGAFASCCLAAPAALPMCPSKIIWNRVK